MIKNALLFLIVCSICLLITESGLRVLLWTRTPKGMIFDKKIIYSYEPFSIVQGIKMNDIGCIGDNIKAEKQAEEQRVFLLGGSTSFSVYYVNSVRNRLKTILPNKNIKVLSCGRPRYTSFVNLINLKENLLSYKPDIVVLYMGINDNIYNSFSWLTGLPSTGFFDWKSSSSVVSFDLFKHYLVDKIIRSTHRFSTNPRPYRSEIEFENNVREIINIAQDNGIQPILSTFALAMPSDDFELVNNIKHKEANMEHFWGDIPSTIAGVEAHNDVITRLAKTYELPLAKVSIPRNSQYYVDICHLTQEGNIILGTTIADTIAVVTQNSKKGE